MELVVRGCTVAVRLSALEVPAAEPPGRRRAASTASGVVPLRRRLSDLLRTLPHPKRGCDALSAGVIGPGSACAALKARMSAVGAFSCAVLGRERRASSGARGLRVARSGGRSTCVTASRGTCSGLAQAVELSTVHKPSVKPSCAGELAPSVHKEVESGVPSASRRNQPGDARRGRRGHARTHGTPPDERWHVPLKPLVQG